MGGDGRHECAQADCPRRFASPLPTASANGLTCINMVHIAASTSNEIWAMDFVHDPLATGQKIRVLTVVDTFSRFSPALDPRFSYRAEDVVSTLERACATTGYPKTIRVNQGTEFVSRDLDLWPMRRASPWTPHAPENLPTAPSLRRSRGASERSASTRIGS
jgi:transposase InsO family protein